MFSALQSLARSWAATPTNAVASCSYTTTFSRSYARNAIPRKRDWQNTSSPARPRLSPVKGKGRATAVEMIRALKSEIEREGSPVARKCNSAFKSKSTTEEYAEQVEKQVDFIKESFPEGWNPPRKVSRAAMEGMRTLHKYDPVKFSTPVLAERFRISPEAVRRILRTKWAPSKERRAVLIVKRLLERKDKVTATEVKERMMEQEWWQAETQRLEEEDKRRLEESERQLRRDYAAGKFPVGINSKDRLEFT